MPEWLLDVITRLGTVGAALGLAFWIVKQFLVERIKNDFSLKLEEVRPLTAEETLRRENFLNAKRDAYYEVIDIAVRRLASSGWAVEGSITQRKIESKAPTEFEINSAKGKIALFSDCADVISLYNKMFDSPSPVDLGNFLVALRKDLGYGDGYIDPEKYSYIFGGESELQRMQNQIDSNGRLK